MKILLVGGGGREHALALALKRSPRCRQLFCAPGNPGIAAVADLVPIGAEDVDALVAFARAHAIDLVVVGPEGPLVAGLVDRLTASGIRAFGPTAAAARLEGSKGFMKDMAAKVGVPTAAYGRFSEIGAARDFVRAAGAPIVVKTDGLAAGKGVVVAMSDAEALAAIEALMAERKFGAAGDELVIESFLQGEEVSFFAISDGLTALPLAAAQDHKRVGDGDTGPNTGGMGAYSPTRLVSADMQQKIMDRCITPLIAGMAAAGTPYRGILFAGLMLYQDQPTLIEYNVRFGDPECQVLMARLRSDLVELLLAACDGRLAGHTLDWAPDPALVVVMASRGYPDSSTKGGVIGGLDDAGAVPGVTILHAGTARDTAGRIVAAGGRVLGITATGASLSEARTRAYQAVERLRWPDGFCRRDIGWRALR